MAQTKTTIKPNLKLAEPPSYNVIYVNDDQTSMEFVVASLMEYFSHDKIGAVNLCMKVHEEGSAIVAVLPYEIAEQRAVEVTRSARGQGFPLLVRIEPDA